jgi:hypothetical protein
LPFRLGLTGGAHIGARRGEAVLRRGKPRNLGLHIALACHLFVAIGGPLSETSLFDRVHLKHGASPTYRSSLALTKSERTPGAVSNSNTSWPMRMLARNRICENHTARLAADPAAADTAPSRPGSWVHRHEVRRCLGRNRTRRGRQRVTLGAGLLLVGDATSRFPLA